MIRDTGILKGMVVVVAVICFLTNIVGCAAPTPKTSGPASPVVGEEQIHVDAANDRAIRVFGTLTKWGITVLEWVVR